MKLVIYARYSSHSQTEQSIEGQLQACCEYAKTNGHTVIREYIDRAITGKTDKRPNFQKMIVDSTKRQFEGVLVYQLDRFARNRYDSATYKSKLKKNGVRVLSARENIGEDASGILIEGVLESMAEYYSAELAQKIQRGMDINGAKHLSTGSNPGFGFKVVDKHIVLNPDTAPIAKEIFERYAAGETVAEITAWLNARQIKTTKGGPFNKNSLHALFRNRRYVGIYTYKGVETPNAVPRIVSDELFEAVQVILGKNKTAPARSRAKAEYLLTTKIFCGHCREMMTGYSGTSKTGTVHNYYICNGKKQKSCTKKTVRKEYIEDLVLAKCREQLTDNNIRKIAKEVAAVCAADYDSSELKRLRSCLKETEQAIEKLLSALELGQAADIIADRLTKRAVEKQDLEKQIAIEQQNQIPLSEQDILFFLTALKKGDADDEKYRRMLVNIFVVAVYLFDDKITYILTVGDKSVTVTDSLLADIDQSNADYMGSFMIGSAPPRRSKRHIACSDFFQKSERTHYAAPPFPNRTRFAGLRFGAALWAA